MIKSPFICLFFLAMCSISESQDCVKLSVQYHPHTNYSTVTESTSKSTIYYDGSDKVLERLSKGGYTNPTVEESYTRTLTITNTYEENAIGDFRLDMRIQRMFDIKKRNGAIVSDDEFDLSDFTLFAICNIDGTTVVDSVLGDDIDEYVRELLKNTFLYSVEFLYFTDKCLKVGDSFFKEYSIELPLGEKPIEINVIARYILAGVELDYAHFDINLEYQMKHSAEEIEATISFDGKGSGIMAVDRHTNFVRHYEVSSTLTGSFSVSELKIDMEMEDSTEVKVETSKN